MSGCGLRLSLALVAALAGLGAHAELDETWLRRAPLPAAVRPLLVLLVDNSQAAATPVAALPVYDPARDYGRELAPDARCDAARVYWRRGAGPAPDCRQQPGIEDGTSPDRGLQCPAARTALAGQGFFVAARAAQWRAGPGARWDALRAGDSGPIACRDQLDLDWDRAPHASPYIFYAGNFLNHLQADAPRAEPFAQLLRRGLSAALRASDDLAVALWRLGPDADGGFAALASATAASAASALEALTAAEPAQAPLAELLAEAASWLSGAAVRSGAQPGADPDAFDAARAGYRSPFAHPCRPVTLAVLSSGAVGGDESAPLAAAALPGFSEFTGGCAEDCLAALARHLEQADLLAAMPGRQWASLQWFAPAPIPQALAAATGRHTSAADPLAFINLVARSFQHDAAVAAGPTLSAAGLAPATRSTHAALVVHGLTAPLARERWAGNLFRYGLRAGDSPLAPPVVVDRDGEPAMEAGSGLPLPGSRSDWSDAPDANLLAGGAAGRLPPAAARRVYSELVSGELSDPRNRLAPDNASLGPRDLGLGLHDPESVQSLLEWLLDARALGDAGPHPPVLAHYPAWQSSLVFAATQDGLLHAFDLETGIERWAWLPRALLSRLPELVRDEATTVRSHGIDGPLVLHRHDADGDGNIDAGTGEHLWLMLGLGRGGERHYALDVSLPDRPRLLWTLAAPAAVAGRAQAEPVIARLAIDDPLQNAGDWIVLLARSDGLHMVDAETGRRLWTAAHAGEAELQPTGFGEPLHSAPRVLDLDGDGRIDRAYLLDAGGGLWRFDFRGGAASTELATARRLAQLGDGTRRFLASPDLSLTTVAGRRVLAIAAGSGSPGGPLPGASERVYLVFDRESAGELSDADLHDATDPARPMPDSAPGWFLRLEAHGAGERVVGTAVSFDHRLHFQTWQPLPALAAAPCGPPRAVRRHYARSVRSGSPGTRVEWPAEDADELPGHPVALRFGFPDWQVDGCTDCRRRAFGIAGTRVFDAGYAGDPVRTSWRRLPPDSP